MAQKGDRQRGKPLNPNLGYAGDPVHHSTSNLPPQRIGIRELRQHASVYVDLVERGYTIDITNRGGPVAQMIPGARPGELQLELLDREHRPPSARRTRGSVLEIEPVSGAPSPGQPTTRARSPGAAARRRGGSVIYLDSSALVKLALIEPESAALSAGLASHPDAAMVSSTLHRAEVLARHLALEPGSAAPRAADHPPGLSTVALSHDLLDNAATVQPGYLTTCRPRDPPGVGA